VSLVKLRSGKVRDLYEVDARTLLLVASDRISAFDHVFAETVPDKGRVLTAMTVFWCETLVDWPTHLVSADPSDLPAGAGDLPDIAGRAMVVRRAEMLPLECVVRARLAGSAWQEYRDRGTVHGLALPGGLAAGDPLPEPLFTPSTKATSGHDVNLSFAEAAELVGRSRAEAARELSLALFSAVSQVAERRGVVVADTKFELGYVDGVLTVCDEIVTPDSSRLWLLSGPHGGKPLALDKQPVRDWAEASGWDRVSPPPPLPPAVVEATRERYVRAYETVSGRSFSAWWGVGSR